MHQRLPPSLHYPITIIKYLKQVGETVKPNDSLFLYSYTTKVKKGNRYDSEEVEVDKKFIQPFKSEFEGNITGYYIFPDQLVHSPQDVCEITEPCQHGVVFEGICANCGKDVSSEGIMNRAPINVTHDASSLTISQDEANKLDEDNKKRLLGARKLSLVVDLDQTIIHAAVDPTIAEWKKDPDNPNYPAVEDVEAFQLMDDGPGMRGCWYYIKQRPGLQDFLKSVSELYELHIYTMGTRQYATKVCEIIDKTGGFFKDRILSRDESGSMTAKSLSRLFPVDTKMVVIIDDRGDVWDYSPNLIRVKPFDFFQGIGDINSAFLPKKQEIPLAPPAAPIELPQDAGSAATTSNGAHEANGTAQVDESAETEEADTSAIEKLMAISGPDNPEVRELQTKGQEQQITSQIEEKPLEKMQREQDQKDEAEAAATIHPAANGEPHPSQSTESDSDSSESSESNRPKHRHAILKNDDEELIHLEGGLKKVHSAFFREYEKRRHSGKGGRVAKLAGGQKAPLPDEEDGVPPELKFVPDVKKIMPSMKHRVLDGVIMVYSGVAPLGTNIMMHDLTRWATSFGAQLVEKVEPGVTHLIAARVGTAKVNKARKMPSVKIVTSTWLVDSMQQWRRVDESRYFLEGLGKQKTTMSENGDSLSNTIINSQELLLSDSEDDASDFDTGDDRPNKRPKIDTSMTDGQFDDGFDEYSPTSIADIDWASADAEVAEFLGSDAESDTDSVASSLSFREKGASKRRREDEDVGDGEGSKRSRASYLSVVATTSSDRDSVASGRAPSEETMQKERQKEEAREKQRQADEEDLDDELLKEFAEGLD